MAEARGREVVVYDKSNKARGEQADIIYHRKPDGSVVVRQSERLRVFSESGEPPIDLGLL